MWPFTPGLFQNTCYVQLGRRTRRASFTSRPDCDTLLRRRAARDDLSKHMGCRGIAATGETLELVDEGMQRVSKRERCSTPNRVLHIVDFPYSEVRKSLTVVHTKASLRPSMVCLTDHILDLLTSCSPPSMIGFFLFGQNRATGVQGRKPCGASCAATQAIAALADARGISTVRCRPPLSVSSVRPKGEYSSDLDGREREWKGSGMEME
jgi:hypothetical protein